MNTVNAEKRSKAESLEVLRSNGKIPGVVYGATVTNTPLSVDVRDFIKIFKVAGESTAITLELDGGKIDALIHEVQYDPVKNVPVHVDFLAIDAKKEITVAIPIIFVGVAPAVKAGLGTLVKVMHEVEVAALPKDLPHEISVDISSLETIDSQISIADIKFPHGVKAVAKESDVVASIAVAKDEVEESAPVDLSAIEVEKKGKKEEETVPEA